MRRSHRSTFGSFFVGVLWAGAAAVAFMAALHLFAPPALDDGDLTAAPGSGTQVAAGGTGLERWARSTGLLPADSAPAASPSAAADRALAPPPTPRLVRESTSGVEAQRGLTRSIQQELTRVSCYAGPIDGAWSEGTRSAMLEFNQAVGARLPVNAPDYILLTMLQGHGAGACAPKGPTVATARAPLPPRQVSRHREPPVSPGNSAIVVTAPPAQPAPAAGTRTLSEVRTTATTWSTTVAAPPAPIQAQPTPSAPLPGRMAIGVLPPPTSSQGVAPAAVTPPSAGTPEAGPPVASTEPPPARDQHNGAAPGRAAPSRANTQRQSASGTYRPGNPFADINRNAP